jgi:SpoIID/LytB domain protein
MPAGWPAEALKAQAVAARSDTVANLSLKHTLEGYDYCATEHCKAYAGSGVRQPATDQAVAATKGEILSDGQRVVPTVFSANCGGWTENNETVWSSPADPALRGASDLVSAAGAAATGPANLARWLSAPPKAYCGDDVKTFRWTKRLSAVEVTALVNKKYAVGTVRDIVPGDRGVSGRLKSIKVVGSSKTETIQKELPIRFAFGGLPSAMFTVDRKTGPDGATVFTFTGGGRGHGVGLCQQGARGRALAGQRYADILKRYFTGVTTERVR